MKRSIYIKFLLTFLVATFIVHDFAIAQEGEESIEKKLDYKDSVILDTDLDGLTDLGEEEIFGTDPMLPDSDGDGFYDGVEVLGETDPLSNKSPVATKVVNSQINLAEKETPWAWYIVRASGLVAFFLLYAVMFLGLSIRTPILRKILKPIYSLNIHAWLSVHSLFFVFLHGGALLFDKFINVNILDVSIPFVSDFSKNEVTMGILGMYLMILLILTSYFRKKMSAKLWRVTHYLNIALYALVVAHSLLLGTDLQEGAFRGIFIYANILLSIIIVINIVTKIITKIKSKKVQV